MYKHEIIYNIEKFYTITGLLPSIIFSSIIIVYICVRINEKERKTILTVLNLLILVYQTSYFLFIVSAPGELRLLVNINSIVYCLPGLIFIIYIFNTVKNSSLKKYEYVGLLLLPCITVIMVLTNKYHQLIYMVYNTFFVKYMVMYRVITLYNYLCLTAGSILLINYINKNCKRSIRYIVYIIIANILLIAVNAYEIFSYGFGRYQLTPIIISIVQIIFIKASQEIDKLNYSSNLYKEILDSIDESIIITDIKNNILYFNRADFNLILKVEKITRVNEILDNITNDFSKEENINKLRNAVNKINSDIISGDFKLDLSKCKYFSYSVYPLKSGKKHIVGKLFTFRNITEYKLLINRLNKKNKELTLKYNIITRHTDIVKQLVQESERQRIINEVSDTAGNYISEIIRILENNLNENDNIEEVKEKIDKAIKLAREGIKSIRRSVSSLKELESKEGEDFFDKSNYC